MVNKFSSIEFPLFAIKNSPNEVYFDHYEIKVRKTASSHLETVDNKRLSGDYFARLMQIPKRLKFEYTCRNIQDCIFSKVKWGIDKEAKIHNLDIKETVPAKWVPIIRVKENLIWLKGISYPYKLNTKENIKIEERTFARVVNYYNEWYLYGFSTNPNNMNKYEVI